MGGVDASDSLAGCIARVLLEWPGSEFLGASLNPLPEPSLSSIHAQVPGAIRIKDLRKKAIIEKLEANNYLNEASLVLECGNSFVHLKCQNGHEKYVRTHCHREYCPTCGKPWSNEHKKRTMRAVDRLMWTRLLGYLVFTLPVEISDRRPDKGRLGEISRGVRPLIQKYFDTPGGFSRYHLFGNKIGTFHTHLNVLFPLTNPARKGKIEKEVLEKLKDDYTKLVNTVFGMNIKQCVVHYSFVYKKAKMFHRIKYVMRPIITADHFEVLDKEEVEHVLSLAGWHNTRWFGKLSNSKYKQYLHEALGKEAMEEPTDKEDHGCCPVCKNRFRYVEVLGWQELPHRNLRYVDENTFFDRATFSELNSRPHR